MFHFLHNSPVREKTYNSENFGRKSPLLTIEHFLSFFFEIRNYTSVKTAWACIVFFFHDFKYYGQNIFSRITVLYLIVKVER